MPLLDLPEVRASGFDTLRSRAKEAYTTLGVPTTKSEEWKYTSLRNLQGTRFGLGTGVHPTPDHLAEFGYGGLDAIRVVLVDGRLSEDLSDLSHGVHGLKIESLCSASNGASDRVGSLVRLDEFALGALNTATFLDGVLIHLAKGAVVEKPIHLLHFTSTSDSEPTYAAPRAVVVAESGSEAFLLETYATLGNGSSFSNAVTEVFVAENAHLEHVKVQRESLKSTHVSLTQVKQERDSSYNAFSITYGGALTRNDFNVYLNGSNLHSRMDGVVVLEGEQHCDNHTRLDHAQPYCDSFEVYKHVLNGRSTAVFNGKIFVHQDAQKTDAKQTNQALLLSPEATINSKPQLEIFADDVKCTHGATVGQIDEEPLFYLRSRGIPLAEARAMLVYAFAAEVLEKITNEQVREQLEALLYAKLTG